MEAEKVRKFKWIWGWEDEKEEAWLRSMAQSGLHLLSSNGFGFYTFVTGQPADVVYRLDYRTERKTDLQDYLQLFQDAGWENVGNMAGWQYFRKPVQPGQNPEIYTDPQSKVAKYQRLLLTLVALLPIFIMLTLNHIPDAGSPLMLTVKLFFTFVMVFFIFAVLKILQRINQLKKKP